MNDNIHISSLVVRARPERVTPITEYCDAFSAVEVHAADPGGKLVLVLETRDQRDIVDFIEALQQQPGVLAVGMVYHHVESAEALDRELEGDTSHEADAS